MTKPIKIVGKIVGFILLGSLLIYLLGWGLIISAKFVTHNFVYYHVPDSFLEGSETKGQPKRQFVPFTWFSHPDIEVRDLVAFKIKREDTVQFARIVANNYDGTYNVIILLPDNSTSTAKLNYEDIIARD